MKLLCDQMLGSLATWLRFMGIDTSYATNNMDDEELLQIAQKEQRILITRDKQLILRAKKRNLDVIPIQSIDLDTQLKKVLSNIRIDTKHILTRCSICNTNIHPINKEEIRDTIPENISKTHSLFWICPHCKKIYWKGSHYDQILKKIQSIQE